MLREKSHHDGIPAVDYRSCTTGVARYFSHCIR
jgi:hypothetical protein